MGPIRNQRGSQKYFKLNENENTIYNNLWTAVVKAVLRGTFIAIDSRIRKERSEINNLSFHL